MNPKVSFNEYVAANLGYQLAARTLPKGKVPTLGDVAVGTFNPTKGAKATDLTKGFSHWFVRVELSDGTANWTTVPSGKYGLIEHQFDRMATLADTVVQLDLDPLKTKHAAIAMLHERDDSGYTDLDLDIDAVDELPMDRALREFAAYHIVSLARDYTKALRKHVPTMINPVSRWTFDDMVRLSEIELTQKDSDDGVDPYVADHPERDGNGYDDWDAARSENSHQVFLELVDYDKIEPVSHAFLSWFKLAPRIVDELRDQVQQSRVSAAEYLASNAASGPTKGRKA